MSTIFSETLEGGSNGATITTGNTNFGSVFGTAPTFSSVQAKYGTLSANFSATAGTSTAYSAFTATASAWWMSYFYVPSNPTAATYIGFSRNGSTKIGDLRIDTAGTITMRDNNSAVYTSPVSIPLGSWFRLEWAVLAGAGTQQLRMFLGGNVDGTNADQDSGVKTATGTAQSLVSTFINGISVSATFQFYADNIFVDNATWVGPTVPTVNFSFAHSVQVG